MVSSLYINYMCAFDMIHVYEIKTHKQYPVIILCHFRVMVLDHEQLQAKINCNGREQECTEGEFREGKSFLWLEHKLDKINGSLNQSFFLTHNTLVALSPLIPLDIDLYQMRKLLFRGAKSLMFMW